MKISAILRLFLVAATLNAADGKGSKEGKGKGSESGDAKYEANLGLYDEKDEGKGSKSGDAKYEADFGPYGKFLLSISGNGSSMSWVSELDNINELGEDMKDLNYHLHDQWNLNEDYSTTDCDTTGGHYDPFLGCGPATAAKAECAALGRTSDESYVYSCGGAYDSKEYNRCEVGDLSGKYGAISIDSDGYGYGSISVEDDPLPAMNYHYQPALSDVSDGTEFASIVFHYGAPRILCGKLNRIE